MSRSEITIDLGALRRNAARAREKQRGGAELWAGGQGGLPTGTAPWIAARARFEGGGAGPLRGDGERRSGAPAELGDARLLVLSPLSGAGEHLAREAARGCRRQAQASRWPPRPRQGGHGMGRFGMSPRRPRRSTPAASPGS
jgi:hypothetical protein